LYAYLLASNPAVLYACQATGNYAATFISKNVSTMTGYESREFLEDSNFWEVVFIQRMRLKFLLD
jgi:hypothetical protein